jgi:ABC-type multidrug transport system fused ATPase/permease subunit
MKRQHPEYPNSEFAKDLWYFLKHHKREFTFVTILLVIGFGLNLVGPIILAGIIDYFITPGKPLIIFYTYLGILAGVEIIATLFRRGGKYCSGILSGKIQRNVKIESFQKLIQRDLLWHDTSSTGVKTQKIMEGEHALSKLMSFYKERGVEMVVSTIGVLGVFAFFNLKYFLLAMLFVTIYLTVEIKLNKKIAEKTYQFKIAKEIATGKAIEFSSNIHTIKSLGLEKSSKNQIVNKENILLNSRNENLKVHNLKWVLTQTISSIFVAIFIFFVGSDILKGALTVGAIVIYVTYLSRLRNVLSSISAFSGDLIESKYGLFRMMEIYKAVPEINENGVRNLNSWNDINIRYLKFKYKEEGVLDDFNLNIKKGEKIGIVGKSGSGKSTLFKLLLKLYLPKKGMIYFDDKPITRIKKDSLVKRIAIVPQETEVFNLSIKENITISRAGRIDYEKYKEALKASKVDRIIAKLENKDLSLIGEKGIRLSGGERQRLGIARAIYKNSDIIIFDEATSNLDYETEKDIQESIDKLKDKTLIVSAHRLPTLKNMDKIIFIDKGKVIEEGTYTELLRKRGEFYKLWRKQGAWKLR